jgi:hypothetical protein
VLSHQERARFQAAGRFLEAAAVAFSNVQMWQALATIPQMCSPRLTNMWPPFQNVGAATINISGEGIQGWKKPDGSDFTAGELSPNLEYLIKDSGLGTFITLTPSF